MTDDDEERLEIRLFTEPSFGQEFDIVVDEITDDYVTGKFQGDDKRRVEEYFLKAKQRRDKVSFACALIQQAEAQTTRSVDEPTPSFFERFSSIWQRPGFAFRVATTVAAAVLLIAGAMMLLRSGREPAPVYMAVDLRISSADRAEGAEQAPVKLSPGVTELRLRLALPQPMATSQTFRARLIHGSAAPLALGISEQTADTVTVVAPAANLTRGSYAVHLSTVDNNGAEQRIRGSYLFRIE